MQVVPVFTFSPIYSNTVQNVYLHGFKEDEGIAFVTMRNANLPGRPPAVSIELGAVATHFGTTARSFTLRGSPVPDQGAPWGIAVVYGLMEG